MAQYAETNVLLAVMDGDLDEAERLISDFTPSELDTFSRQLQLTRDLVTRQQRRMGSRR